MTGRGSSAGAARLLCAAASAALAGAPVFAQSAPAPQQPQPIEPAELDPNAPLAPMPDLGVEWPDLNAKDTAAPPAATTVAPPNATPTTPPKGKGATIQDGTGDIRYTVAVEGLAAIGDAEGLLTAFRQQSTLEAERKHPANAAQVARRASADADLLVELLRSQGYYDAMVDPSTQRAGDTLQVVLTADPGEQYKFASVELPGLQAAGPEGAKLRDIFAIKPGDPVVAQDVIAAGLALTTALGEQGYAEAKIGE